MIQQKKFLSAAPPLVLKFLMIAMINFVAVSLVHAQVISPSGEEVGFSFSTLITASKNSGLSVEDEARLHASHLFGLFQSPTMIQRYGLRPDLFGGIGAPQNEMKIVVFSKKNISPEKIQISYAASGKMLLQKDVAASMLAKRSITLPMPSDSYEVYNKNCTDSHYYGEGDYWYFYDAFRRGCESLLKPPLATNVQISITPISRKKLDATPRLDLLRGNNGNGVLFSISVIHGYSESATTPYDDGRINYDRFTAYLDKMGFTLQKNTTSITRAMKTYNKSMTLTSGQTIEVQVKHLLVDTTISSKNVLFAKFFKDAVENSDVILYAGHSGLGGNLDIPSLEAKAGKFTFNAKKRQIFFFNSCSSYSYYLPTFSAEKTRARIDILTNGLASYFDSFSAVHEAFMDVLLDPKIIDTTWLSILNSMEKTLNGKSFLLNVGGV